MVTKKTFDLNILNVTDGTVKKSQALALNISEDNAIILSTVHLNIKTC